MLQEKNIVSLEDTVKINNFVVQYCQNILDQNLKTLHPPKMTNYFTPSCSTCMDWSKK